MDPFKIRLEALRLAIDAIAETKPTPEQIVRAAQAFAEFVYDCGNYEPDAKA